jgi:hypothetical protein
MQNDFHFHLDLSVPKRTLTILMAAAILITVTPEIGSENVTLSTYYPAPSGVYARMITTSNTYLATTNGSVGIGTTTPGAKLHVVASGGFGNEAVRAQSNSTFFSGVDGAGSPRFAINNDTTDAWNNPRNTLRFYGSDSGWFPVMDIDNGGGANPTSGLTRAVIFRSPAEFQKLGINSTGCATATCATNGACACNGTTNHITFFPGLRVVGTSYQNRGFPPHVDIGGGSSTQVWALNTTNGVSGWGTLKIQSAGPGTVWCCPK